MLQFENMRLAAKFVVVIVLMLSCGSAFGVSYDDFPPTLQSVLNDRIADLNAQGGICLAGRVTMSDGAYISGGADVMVNLHNWIDEPMWVYEDGWFIAGRRLSSYYSGTNRGVVVRAFAYDPIDASVTILDGEMTYLDFVMQRTAPEDLARIEGTVADENDMPFYNSWVSIAFPFSNHGYTSNGYTYPHMSMRTGPDGAYSFDGLSSAEHRVVATASEYAYHQEYPTPPVGGTFVQDLRLYPDRRIVVEYVYQADGSLDFTSGDLETGIVSWLNGEGGLDFSEGVIEGLEPEDVHDLDLAQTQDVMEFLIGYGNGNNGYYDAGAVDFASVATAASTGYATSRLPCLVGHVYVVRTFAEDNYAKFIVRSDESSFRTVTPGDPDPIEFLGYGLTVDFSYSSNYGQLYVEKHFAEPTLEEQSLPYYWDVSGMAGVSFMADLSIVYDEWDLAVAGMSEASLAVMVSHNGGASWQELPTTVDAVNNVLEVAGLNSFGWFAVADMGPDFAADLDGDGDVDCDDYSRMNGCIGGPGVTLPPAGCAPVDFVGSDFDADGDVDLVDFVEFQLEFTGSGA